MTGRIGECLWSAVWGSVSGLPQEEVSLAGGDKERPQKGVSLAIREEEGQCWAVNCSFSGGPPAGVSLSDRKEECLWRAARRSVSDGTQGSVSLADGEE